MESFEIGERVMLAKAYYVNREGDCATDSNIEPLTVGRSLGVVAGETARSGVLTVAWDDAHPRLSGHLRVNVACLVSYPPVTDEDVDAAIQSILRVKGD